MATLNRKEISWEVIIAATMSLDGFIADRHDNVGPLFDWYSRLRVSVHHNTHPLSQEE